VVVMSSDTYTNCRSSPTPHWFVQKGLLAGALGPARDRREATYVLHVKLVEDLCHVLIKAHVMTGDDAISKMGTKMQHSHQTYKALFFFFGETPVLSEANLYQAEQYLVHV